MSAIAGRLGEIWISCEGGFPVTSSPPSGSSTGVTSEFAPNQADNAGVLNDGSGAGTATGALVDATMNGNVDELETTVHNTSGASPTHGTARTYIPNFHDETLDVSFRYNEEDEESMGVLVSALNSYLFHFWYVPDGEALLMGTASTSTSVTTRAVGETVGANAFYGKAFSTSFSPGSPLDDVTTFDVTLRLSGTNIVTLTA
jgi:hypothetical protein